MYMCSLIKEFEQEARTDNMPAAELTSRKKGLVQQLNEYIAKKKELGNDIAGRKELIGAAKRGDGPKDYNSKLRGLMLSTNSTSLVMFQPVNGCYDTSLQHVSALSAWLNAHTLTVNCTSQGWQCFSVILLHSYL